MSLPYMIIEQISPRATALSHHVSWNLEARCNLMSHVDVL